MYTYNNNIYISEGKVYYRTGTYGDAGYLGSQWDEVDPDSDHEFVNIDVGYDVVVAANKKDQLFARDGM